MARYYRSTMASAKLQRLLATGTEEWNAWRIAHRGQRLDLREVVIEGQNLTGINLSGADLRGASLRGSLVEHANLRGARFGKTDLRDVSFRRTVLDDIYFGSESALQNVVFAKATFARTRFSGCYLDGANFGESALWDSSLDGCSVRQTIFDRAAFGYTVFREIDLSQTIGLSTADHYAPSSLDMQTLRLSRGLLPDVFLKGCGLRDDEIVITRLWTEPLTQETLTDILYEIDRLKGSRPVQKHAVFISYAHADTPFVDHLQAKLDEAGVRCWRDVHDLTSGRLELQLDRAIRLNPIVIVVLSKHSVASDWVEWEVSRARELERETKRDVLCPIALDDSWKQAEWPGPLKRQLAKYNIMNFEAWSQTTLFTAMTNKLVEGLDLFYRRDPSRA